MHHMSAHHFIIIAEILTIVILFGLVMVYGQVVWQQYNDTRTSSSQTTNQAVDSASSEGTSFAPLPSTPTGRLDRLEVLYDESSTATSSGVLSPENEQLDRLNQLETDVFTDTTARRDDQTARLDKLRSLEEVF